jgi:hypothetical protein
LKFFNSVFFKNYTFQSYTSSSGAPKGGGDCQAAVPEKSKLKKIDFVDMMILRRNQPLKSADD